MHWPFPRNARKVRERLAPKLRPRLAHSEHWGHCVLCWFVFVGGHGLESWAGGAVGTIMVIHIVFGLDDEQ